MKNISLIGSTGSIGTQTLEVIESNSNLNVTALTANSNVDLLAKQIRKFKPTFACVADKNRYSELKSAVADLPVKLSAGYDGLIEAATLDESDTVLTAIVGNAGLELTVEAIKSKKNIALANKETLVTAGEIIIPLCKENNVSLLPVDSEHSAIFQCLNGEDRGAIRKIILTASGGPFYGKTSEQLENVTVSDALNHPNWSMGNKITIDS
ncbi:MAG: 1-deoxy-D-xylulose-5-phosphate reductoisomerase, partial [Ruminococcaceae bacterium]|nr:1-deoxy-D-xylulose-5-phosphate reductoisomerase [Oscillospiraceae bacterium]